MTPISEYNYPLPDERIAKYPLAERDHSKLLVYQAGTISEDHFFRIGDYIPEGALLVYNNTRVIQARLVFHKPTGARIEVFCLKPVAPVDYQLALSSTSGCTWQCMIGNAKKWQGSEPLSLVSSVGTLRAYKEQSNGNTFAVRFAWNNDESNTKNSISTLSFAEILESLGELPIPPYLHRPTEDSDKTTYQTVYSRIKGSVAAPTAGLHFTDAVLDDLRKRGVQTAELTLHVGAGTFQPVKHEDAEQHTMHTEIIAVPRDTIAQIQRQLGHIVAVGTTSMRTLESLYFLGVIAAENTAIQKNLSTSTIGQNMPYERRYTITPSEALQALLDYLDNSGQDTLHAATQIMIRPGYIFRIVDVLITNFHQPQSTLLLLVSAFVNGDWHRIYDYALGHDFRFLSYGDSSILFRSAPSLSQS